MEAKAEDFRKFLRSPTLDTYHPYGLVCSWKIVSDPGYKVYVRVLALAGVNGTDALKVQYIYCHICDMTLAVKNTNFSAVKEDM